MTAEKLLLLILLLPAIGSAIIFYLGRKNELYRNIFLIFITFINFILVLLLYKYIKHSVVKLSIPNIMGVGLHLKLDSFRYIFVFITSFVWFIITVYSSQYLINYTNRSRYFLFFMITYVSTLGVFISENLLNLFTFFEIMSFASYPLIIHDEDENAHSAGRTYIAMATAGGLILLMGIFILYSFTNTLNIEQLSNTIHSLGNIKYVISSLLIIGFGVKAGMVPLHIWLPKAHPAAPTPASAVLSGILVKTGIFGIILTVVFMMEQDFYLSVFLICIGLANMFTGGFLAIFQNNIKKTLAYSSMSQLGYLMLGIGCIGLLKDHQGIAVYGTLFHVFNHAIFKVMLFMGIGIIYMVTHKLDINDLRGFGTFKPVLKLTFFIGFCAIIGLPGFNGFISKTMIHHSLTDAGHITGNSLFIIGDILFYISSAFTTAYLLKLYIALFVENNSRYYASYRKLINLRALFPMVISAFLILLFGIKPNIFSNQFVNLNEVFHLHESEIFKMNYYNLKDILSSLINIGIGVLIYSQFIKKKLIIDVNGNKQYINPTKKWFNLENNFYKPIAHFIFEFTSKLLHVIDNLLYIIERLISSFTKYISNIEVPVFEMSNVKILDFVTNMTKPIKNKPLKKDLSNIKESLQATNQNAKITVAEDFKNISTKMNSITYSIFLFGAVLVIILLSVIIFR